MGKYDYICELTGAENYSKWRKQMKLALQGERLWPHCSNGSDPANLADFASVMPTPVDKAGITDVERERILDWLAKDAQAKALIDRKISPAIASHLVESQTARQQWEFLAQHCTRNNLLSQYELRMRIRSERLSDAEDATRYIRVFEDARRRLIQMGVAYTTEESIFDLLQGLPEGVDWQTFTELILGKLMLSSSTSVTFTSLSSLASSDTPSFSSITFTFEDAAKLLAEKANDIAGRRKLVGSRSEYANSTVTAGKTIGKINSATGIRIHKNNPTGIRCTNESCAGRPRADTHDKSHCYRPGGGMEDKAPDWMYNKKEDETAVYSLTNVRGGTCLDLSGTDKVSIIGYGYHGGFNQMWVFEGAGADKTFYLKSKGSSQYLSTAGEPRNGQKVVAAELPYAWRVEDEQGVDGGVRLLPASNPNFCVDLSDHGNPTPGTPVQLRGCWKLAKSQVWKLQQIQ